MRYFLLLLFTACQIGDDLAGLDASPEVEETEIFSACEEDKPCETGLCKALDQENTAEVCTVECLTHSDCQAYDINAFCICDFTDDHICWVNVPGREDTPRHCLLPCNPLNDTCEEGLSCELVVFSVEPPSIRFACRPPYEETP